MQTESPSLPPDPNLPAQEPPSEHIRIPAMEKEMQMQHLL
jgi:hypothetical protein